MTARVGDRIAGAIILAISIWYWIEAGTYEAAFGDPAGPGFFPRAIAVPMGLFAAWMIVRPDSDQIWFRWPHVLGQAAMLVVLFAYPFAIEPVGFPIATSVGAALMGRILGGTWLQSVISGLVIGVGLYIIFDRLFGLPLPAGPILG